MPIIKNRYTNTSITSSDVILLSSQPHNHNISPQHVFFQQAHKKNCSSSCPVKQSLKRSLKFHAISYLAHFFVTAENTDEPQAKLQRCAWSDARYDVPIDYNIDVLIRSV